MLTTDTASAADTDYAAGSVTDAGTDPGTCAGAATAPTTTDNEDFSSSSQIPPDIADVEAYIREQGLTVNATNFWNYYESNGWMIGPNPMCDWKAAVRGWSTRARENGWNVVNAAPISTI